MTVTQTDSELTPRPAEEPVGNRPRRGTTLSRRLFLALMIMVLPLVAVAGVRLGGYRAGIGALQEFREESVDESKLIEEIRDLLTVADDLGEAYVEEEDSAARESFLAQGRKIDQGFDALESLGTENELELLSKARASWVEAVDSAEKATLVAQGPTDDRLDPFHDAIDESAAYVSDLYSINVRQVAAEISVLRRRELFEVFGAMAALLIGASMAALLARRMYRSIVTPLRALEEAAALFGADDLSHRVAVEGDDELARVSGALNTMAVRLDQSRQQRAGLLDKTLSTAEEERRRLAAELHDGPIQGLAALGYRLEKAMLHLERKQTEPAQADLDGAQIELSDEIGSLRRLMAELRPPVLDERGLKAAISDYVAQMKVDPALACTVEVDLGERLDPVVETLLYRLVLEALVNVKKHAGAKAARVEMHTHNGSVLLSISDDGVGFEPAGLTTRNDGHYGLAMMRERVQLAGGLLDIDSSSGSGTVISVVVPRASGTSGNR